MQPLPQFRNVISYTSNMEYVEHKINIKVLELVLYDTDNAALSAAL